ncbi:hypothetical protein EDB19DRAFT_1838552 [Suillus lakei]|nr:hypothetical protein EDB19DRAFT_1838552 [Suillus lakei]
MLNTKLIQRLLKRLWQVLAALKTSSVQRLCILVSCFRRFMTKAHVSLARRNTDSQSTTPECCTVLTSSSSTRCAQATLPLPIHNRQIITTGGTQDVVPFAMPVPCIPQQIIPPQISHFVPFVANDVLRYENRPLVVEESFYRDKSRGRDHIPALMRCFPNEERSLKRTQDETTFRLIDECVNGLYDLARAESASLEADDIELVVQLPQLEVEGAQVSCQYYFVDHAARTLFWLHDNDQATVNIFSGLQGVVDPSHIRYALESEYWTHCERYPNYKMDRVKLLRELREVVMHASAEIITTDMSSSPFDADELSRILELINHLQENAQENDFPHSTCIIARFMHYFYRSKFFDFCGLPCARLDADRSVYEDDNVFHPLTSSLSLALDAMLFWAPQVHLKGIRSVWVDECINVPRWKDFNKNIMAEWTGITIYSTVMLAVDTEFLSNLTRTFFGVKALATVHSLPYAMLMWGMVFFAIGLLYNVFKITTTAMLASVVSGKRDSYFQATG